MPLGFRAQQSRSWLSAVWGPVAARDLRERLLERCLGHCGAFLTLTYQREHYTDPRDLYVKASEDRHVRLFIRRLSKYLGQDLTGRWLCKLEFQKGGWVHWHLLILDLPASRNTTPHADIERLWGHGYVWVAPMTPETIAYTCKYIAKDSELPTFLYLERSRSVRIVRVSPGFWGNPSRPGGERSPRMPFYRTVGDCLEDAEAKTVLYDPDTRRYASVKHSPEKVLEILLKAGGVADCAVNGFLVFRNLDFALLDHYLRPLADLPGTISILHPSAAGEGDPACGGEPAGPRSGPLHLNTICDPHTTPSVTSRKWVDRFLTFALGWRDDEQIHT